MQNLKFTYLSPLLVLCIFGVILILYNPTVNSLYNLWVEYEWAVDTYSHGTMLLAVSAYLFYRRWHWLKKNNALNIKPNMLGLFGLIIASLVWTYSVMFDIPLLQKIIFFVVIWMFIWGVIGYKNAEKLIFPLLLPLCAMPIWSYVNGIWLQNITAIVVSAMLEITGFFSYREGIYIYVPAGSFRIAEYCSGLHQLMVTLPIALIYSHLNMFRLPMTIIYVTLAMLMSFFVNDLRIYIVVVVGQLTNMQHYLILEEHETLGWIIYGFAIFGLIYGTNKLLGKYHKVICTQDPDLDSAPEPIVSMWQRRDIWLTLVFAGAGIGPIVAFINAI